MNPLIAKARTTLRSARVLLELGDATGAANRTYYAIFDAMRATIQHFASVDLEEVKTHHGVFRLFEKHVLAPGLMTTEDARIIYRAQELRWSGDYDLCSTRPGAGRASARTRSDLCGNLRSARQGR